MGMDMEEAYMRSSRRAPFAWRVNAPKDRFDRLDALRDFYRCADKDILADGRAHAWAIDPYECDWTMLFSPIEDAFWCAIRAEGAVLYPQYPIGRFFADFANPIARVVVECDGKRWHMDKEHDAERQAEIERLGWRVYRITGRECLDENWEERGEGGERLEFGRAQRLVREICERHRISGRYARSGV